MHLPRDLTRTSYAALCALAIAAAYAHAAPAQEARPQFTPIPETGLIVLPSARSITLAPNAACVDAGEVNPLDSPTLEHEFILKNQGRKSLTIGQITTSCDCVGVRFPSSKGGRAITLKPGQETTASVSISVTARHAGPFTNSVYVPVEGHAGYAVLLQIDGRITPVLKASPATLDFGKLYRGQSRAMTVTVTGDSRLVPGGLPLTLLSPDPSLKVGRFPRLTTHGAATTMTYSVTLQGGRPGMLTGLLTLHETVRSPSQPSSVSSGTSRAALDGVSIPFSATIVARHPN